MSLSKTNDSIMREAQCPSCPVDHSLGLLHRYTKGPVCEAYTPEPWTWYARTSDLSASVHVAKVGEG